MEIIADTAIEPSVLPVFGSRVSGWYAEEPWGQRYDAGYMPEDVAWSFIVRTIERLRNGELQPLST